MARKVLLILVIFSIAVSAAGCSLFNGNNSNKNTNANIYARPKALNLERGKLSELPDYKDYSAEAFQVDLRGYDLTGLDMKGKVNNLLNSDFDNDTRWPDILPKGFDPKRIIRYGKDPGLGMEELHDEGIDGSGVSVAIIGEPILVDHTEYKLQVKLYNELDFKSESASVEGTAAAAVLAGDHTGVSPGANLYYVAIKPESKEENASGAGEINQVNQNDSRVSSAIDRIVKFNKELSKDDKIRVLCIQEKITPEDRNYSSIMVSMEKAVEEGIFVVSTISHKLYDSEIYFKGLGREALSDPDKLSSYSPGKSWESSFYSFGRYMPTSNTLFLPSDSRCTASPTGTKDYAFYTVNDWNLYLPYAAGLYALACQVKPSVTPGEFVERAIKTSDMLEIYNEIINYKYKLKNIVNPLRLIKDLKQ